MAGEPDRARTLAVDEWLQRPDVRITRALRGAYWLTAAQIFRALELEASQYERYQDVLKRLVNTGHVRCKREDGVVSYELFLELPAPGTSDRMRPSEPGTEDGQIYGGWFWWRGSWRSL